MSGKRPRVTDTATGLDPTKVLNQPALRTSSGAIWLVMGGLFVAVSAIPLGALIFVRPGPSQPAAVTTLVCLGALYGGLVVTRLVTSPGPRRLRVMAAFMLATACVAVVGTLVCVHLERTL